MLYGSGAASYLWNNGVTDSVAFLPSATLTYKVTGTDLNGCKNTDSTIVTVNLLPSVNITTATTTVCIDAATITLVASPTGGIWTGAGVTGNIFTPSTAGTGIKLLIYTYSDANSCSASDSVNITVNPCSGIDESLIENALKVFPNPNNGIFYFEINSEALVVIYNSLGEVVLSQKMSAGKNTVDLSGYSNGIYMLSFIIEGNSKTMRIIKQ